MIVLGKYEVLEEIGKGGMGIVYRAKDLRLGRVAALKELVLGPLIADSEKDDIIARFNQEAQTAALLNHPNIITVFDVGEERERHFIAMEYLPGKTLKDFLDEDYKFSLEEITDILIQIASGLDHAHSKGVIHRDIKPDNMKILENNVIKITDFGIARIESSTSNLTQDGTMLGTLGYISPEQLHNSKGVDSRADIFSFGAMMYELFTKKLPFDGGTVGATILKIMTDEPVLPSKINPDINPFIEKIIMKCLIKDPDRRYQKFKDVTQELTVFKMMLSNPALFEATKETATRTTPGVDSIRTTSQFKAPPPPPSSNQIQPQQSNNPQFDSIKTTLASMDTKKPEMVAPPPPSNYGSPPPPFAESRPSVLKNSLLSGAHPPSQNQPPQSQMMENRSYNASIRNTSSGNINNINKQQSGGNDSNDISISFIRVIGKSNNPKGQFVSPRGIAVSNHGLIYVGDTQNRRVQVFDSMGNWQYMIQISEMQAPCDIDIDETGKTYVLDSNDGKIRIFDTSGNLISSFGGRGTGNGQVRSATGIAVANDKIYVADNEGFRVMVFNQQGNVQTVFGKYGEKPGEYKNPYSIATDGNRIYVLDYGLARVQVIDKDGISRLVFGQRGTTKAQFSIPKGIEVDKFGRIYVCDTLNHRVQIFDKTGKWIYSFGSKGSGNSQFMGPEGIAITNDGYIYILDKGNNRIQVFTYET